jgi:putative transcriptional regulator
MVEGTIVQTDWAAQDALTDVDIARQVAANPDAAAILTDAQTAASIVRTVRARLGISQVAFAARYHIPIGTLRDWEQARKHPDAPALAYLRVISQRAGYDGARACGHWVAALPWPPGRFPGANGKSLAEAV